MNKIKKFLYSGINSFFLIFYLIVLFVVIFCSSDVITSREFSINNLWLVVIGLLITITFVFFEKRVYFSKKKVILIFSILLFCFHLLLIFNILFKTGWDAGTVMDAAYNIVFFNKSGMNKFDNIYFSMYPNNIFLLFYEVLVCFVVKFFSGNYFVYNLVLVLINSFIFIITGILLYLILDKKLKNNKVAIFGLLIYAILIGISPWFLIPYSDSIGLIFVILILYIYLFFDKNNLIKYFLISFLSFVGFKLKPQVFIIFIAVTIIKLLNLLYNKDFKEIAKFIGIIFVSGLIVMVPVALIEENMELDREKKFGITHFLMMGLNYETSGVFSQDDVDFSYSCLTKEIRTKKNLEVVKNRIYDYGGIKLLKHLKNKILVNYNDGTFAFGTEGNFYSYEYENKLKSSNFLKKLFYSNGDYYNEISTIRHGVWLLVLLFVILGVGNKDKDYILVLKLSLIGLLLYLMLFEARARYLFIYVPIFIIIAMSNLDCLLEKIEEKNR